MSKISDKEIDKLQLQIKVIEAYVEHSKETGFAEMPTHALKVTLWRLQSAQEEISKLREDLKDIKQGISNALRANSQRDAYHTLTVILQKHSDPWGDKIESIIADIEKGAES